MLLGYTTGPPAPARLLEGQWPLSIFFMNSNKNFNDNSRRHQMSDDELSIHTTDTDFSSSVHDPADIDNIDDETLLTEEVPAMVPSAAAAAAETTEAPRQRNRFKSMARKVMTATVISRKGVRIEKKSLQFSNGDFFSGDFDMDNARLCACDGYRLCLCL